MSSKPVLSERQRSTLEELVGYIGGFGMPPTRAELGHCLGVSAQTADFHLRALERKGFVRCGRRARELELCDPARALVASEFVAAEQTINQLGGSDRVPIVGRVAAGTPITAIENIEDSLPIPAGTGADFALRVRGDSMIEAGILDGDLVLVQQCDDAAKGDIVVALIGDGEEIEATVKRYLPGRGRVVLRPANATMEDIVISSDQSFMLAGRVVGVLRLF